MTKNNINFGISIKNSSRMVYRNYILIIWAMLKNPKTYVLSFFIPCIVMMCMYVFYSYSGNNILLPFRTIGFSLIPGFCVMMILNSTITEWKESILLKRIRTAGSSQLQFLFSIWLAALTIGVLSDFVGIGIMSIYGIILREDNQITMLDSIGTIFSRFANFFGYITGVFMTVISSIAISTLISGNIKSGALVQSFTIILAIFFIAFSEIFIAPDQFSKVKAMNIFGYFIPQKYGSWTMFMYISGVDYDPSRLYETILKSGGDRQVIASFTAPYQSILGGTTVNTGLLLVSALTFKANVR